MEDPDELHQAIAAAYKEHHKVLVKTVEIVSLNHPSANSNDPKIAFSNILNNCIQELKKSTDEHANKHLFTTNKRDKLQPWINISELDNNFLLNILVGVETFLQIDRQNGICVSQNHTVACCDDCPKDCDHSSPTCKDCRSNNGRPIRRCKHTCKTCNEVQHKCENNLKMCCAKCNICVNCNQDLTKTHMLHLTCNGAPSKYDPCKFYLFLHCLVIFLNWRIVYAHTSVPKLQRFIDGNWKLDNFEMCNDPNQLFTYIKAALQIILEYISDGTIFPNNSLTEAEAKIFNDNMNMISEFGESLAFYLKKGNVERILNSFILMCHNS